MCIRTRMIRYKCDCGLYAMFIVQSKGYIPTAHKNICGKCVFSTVPYIRWIIIHFKHTTLFKHNALHRHSTAMMMTIYKEDTIYLI